MLTESNSKGISDVFHSFILPEDKAPEGLIDRWNLLSKSSPIKVKVISGKENLAIYSVWNEDLESFTISEKSILGTLQPTNRLVYVFMINNVVLAMFGSPENDRDPDPKLIAAFSDLIYIIALKDDSLVDVGYTYDGEKFFAPEKYLGDQ